MLPLRQRQSRSPGWDVEEAVEPGLVSGAGGRSPGAEPQPLEVPTRDAPTSEVYSPTPERLLEGGEAYSFLDC